MQLQSLDGKRRDQPEEIRCILVISLPFAHHFRVSLLPPCNYLSCCRRFTREVPGRRYVQDIVEGESLISSRTKGLSASLASATAQRSRILTLHLQAPAAQEQELHEQVEFPQPPIVKGLVWWFGGLLVEVLVMLLLKSLV